MESILNKKQLNYCHDQANNLAKQLMDKDVSQIFGQDGNANFCIETISVLSAGTILTLSNQINIDPYSFLDAFMERVRYFLDKDKIPHLTLLKGKKK